MRKIFIPEISAHNMPGYLLFLLLLIGLNQPIQSQEAPRFADDVAEIQARYDTILDKSKDTYVFAGSSSIRLWETLEEYYPDHQIVNSGFGGSETADLLKYLEPLVLSFNPKKVFLYEGDNDINSKKKPKRIIAQFEELIGRIKNKGTAGVIVIISAKPSIARWHLKGKYRRLNKKFAKLCSEDPILEFADVWTPMLEGRKLRKDLFIDDGLHMNDKGYEIWYEVLKKYVN